MVRPPSLTNAEDAAGKFEIFQDAVLLRETQRSVDSQSLTRPSTRRNAGSPRRSFPAREASPLRHAASNLP